jgi:hypothetical protein
MSMRELNLGGVRVERRTLDLRELGFEGRVSDEARAEIAALERRAQRVLSTAYRYWFGRRG